MHTHLDSHMLVMTMLSLSLSPSLSLSRLATFLPFALTSRVAMGGWQDKMSNNHGTTQIKQ